MSQDDPTERRFGEPGIGNFVVLGDGSVVRLPDEASSVYIKEQPILPPVFISYASEDRPEVLKLVEHLREAGFTVWFDRDDIATGEDWLREINNGLHRCVALVAVISDHTRAKIADPQRGLVLRHEHQEALRLFRPVIPVLLDGNTLPPYFPPRANYLKVEPEGQIAPSLARIEAEVRRHVRRPGRFLIDQSPSAPRTFVGREEELRAVYELLQGSDAVVVTSQQAAAVQGQGGIGKTMLAGELVRRLAPRYPGGVLVRTFGSPEHGPDGAPLPRSVDLAASTLNEWARLALKSAFEEGHSYTPDEVRGALSTYGELLVFIDDVWDTDVAALATVLSALPPGTDRLVTTRFTAVVSASGSRLYRLGRLSQEDGVALLRDRLEKKPGPLPPEELLVCAWQAVDGHALALELIAGRAQENSTFREVVEELEACIEGGEGLDEVALLLPEEAHTRDSSLLATLRLSYEHLTEEIKPRFRALGAFAPGGSFDRPALAALWGDLDERTTRRTVEVLLAAGLITPSVIGSNGTGPRYQQHQVLRAYALGLLKQAGELHEAGERHFTYYAREHGSHERNLPYSGRHPHITADWANVLHALEWGFEHDPETACDLVGSLENSYMQLRVPHQEAVRLIEGALRAAERAGYGWGQANMLKALGNVARKESEYERAAGYFDRAMVIYEELGDRLGQANTLLALGNVAYMLDEYDTAIERFNRALPLFEAVDDPLGQANTLKALGDVIRIKGDNDEAMRCYNRALPLLEQIGDTLGVANTLKALGDLAMRLDDLTGARDYYDRAMPLYEQLDARLGQANLWRALGDLAVWNGEYEEAREHYYRALPLYEEVGVRLGVANTFTSLGDMCVGQQRWAEAIPYYLDALAISRAIGDRLGIANILVDLGRAQFAVGDHEQGIASMREAAALFTAVKNRRWAQIAYARLADMLETVGRSDEAAHIRREHNVRPHDQAALPPELVAELQRIADLLIPWVQTDTWGESRSYLIEHQADLLSDNADMALSLLIEMNPDAEELKDHLTLLRACREQGIDTAYDRFLMGREQKPQRRQVGQVQQPPQAVRTQQPPQPRQPARAESGPVDRTADLIALLNDWMEAPDPAAARDFLRAHQDDLLTDEAEQAAELLTLMHPGEPIYREYLETLRVCRAEGVDAVYGEVEEAAAAAGEEEPEEEPVALLRTADLMALLNDWMEAPDHAAARDFLRAHQADLLTDEAERAAEFLILMHPGDPIYREYLEVLRACRADGIGAVYGEDEEAFDEGPVAGQGEPAEEEVTLDRAADLMSLLREWIAAPDRTTSRAFIKANRAALLSRAADETLAIMAMMHPDDTALKEHLRLLRACRQQGIDAAYGT